MQFIVNLVRGIFLLIYVQDWTHLPPSLRKRWRGSLASSLARSERLIPSIAVQCPVADSVLGYLDGEFLGAIRTASRDEMCLDVRRRVAPCHDSESPLLHHNDGRE